MISLNVWLSGSWCVCVPIFVARVACGDHDADVRVRVIRSWVWQGCRAVAAVQPCGRASASRAQSPVSACSSFGCGCRGLRQSKSWYT
eukprot:scaffold208281_cov37-Tisochrysis_lutea.AAC.1